MAPRFGLKMYEESRFQSTALGGNSVELVIALYDGVIDCLGQARELLGRSELLEGGRKCSKALSILNGLRETLDFERGEPVASQLLQFYNVISSQIISAQVRRDVGLLSSAVESMRSVKLAWEELACQVGQGHLEKFLAPVHGDSSKPAAVALSGAGAAAAL